MEICRIVEKKYLDYVNRSWPGNTSPSNTTKGGVKMSGGDSGNFI